MRSLPSTPRLLLAAILAVVSFEDSTRGADVIVDAGEVWKFFRGTIRPAEPLEAWRALAFDDSAWEEGPTGIGFGDGDDATVIGDMQGAYIAIFTRKEFLIPDPGSVRVLTLSIDFDDGFVAYLNGTEVARLGVPPGAEADINAAASLSREAGMPESFEIPAALLVAGRNVLAIEVRNNSVASSDVSLLPRLSGETFGEQCPSLFTCAAGAGVVSLGWSQGLVPFERIEVERDGAPLPGSPVPAGARELLDADPPPRDAVYTLLATLEGGLPCSPLRCVSTFQDRGLGSIACALDLWEGAPRAVLAWTGMAGAARTEVRRQGVLLATLPGDAARFEDPQVPVRRSGDAADYQVRQLDASGGTATLITLCIAARNAPPRAAIAVDPPGGLVRLAGGAASVVLDGRGSDDGDGGAQGLAFLWTKVSGPEGDVLESPREAITKVDCTAPGERIYRLQVHDGQVVENAAQAEVTVTVLPQEAELIRGDADSNRALDITDAVAVLGSLFLGQGDLPCLDAADADDSGTLDISDPVRVLGHLFLGQPALPLPGPACGPDPTADALECRESGCR